MSTELEKIEDLKEQVNKLEQQIKDRDKTPEITVGCVFKYSTGAITRYVLVLDTFTNKLRIINIASMSTTSTVLRDHTFATCIFVAPSLEEYYKEKFTYRH